MQKLSVLIPAFNNETLIRQCLQTVHWADEIVVCDSFSTDRTLEIAKEYHARIIQHEYINSAKQKNWAIPQCKNEWVMIVDTDEILEPQLVQEIEDWLSRDSIPYDAFRIPRKNLIYGKWVKYGGLYPDYQIRLFRKSQGKYREREVHAHMMIEGPVGTLRYAFLHDGFKDISTWLMKYERYTRYERDEKLKQDSKFCIWKYLFGTPWVFIRTYFFKLAFREGYRGFLISILDAIAYFLVGARLWESQNLKTESSS